jgi:aryl-alcohol dehydrogenase-like predicted oxidoreductase
VAPEFIFGTAGLHRVGWRPARQTLLQLAYDAGFRAFDTAPLYGNGLAEAELGAVFPGVQGRIRITTKFGIPVSAYGAARPWTFLAERAARMVLDRGYRASFDRRDWSVRQMRADLEGSLRRLRTDHVARFCLHEPLAAPPLGLWDDLCAEAEDLKRQGKIGAFGLSGEQSCMAELAQRPGLDFVQTRTGPRAAGLGFAGPVLVYGVFGAFRAQGQGDFNAYLKRAAFGPAAGCLLSSTKPAAVAAYAPLFG